MPAIQFTMEIAENNKLPFLGIMIEKSGCHLTTSVYRKPTDTGLLLHYQSHVYQRYKRSLLNTMLNRAYRLSSTKESFTKECQHLKRMFTKLKYPVNSSTQLSPGTRGLRSKAVMKSQLKLTRLHQNLSE